MNAEETGALIRRLRRERGLTQAQLAGMLQVSDKAVSKWERGAGCPDVEMIPALAAAFRVSAESLLSGNLPVNERNEGSMRRLKVYQCPQCGNLLTATGSAEIACCGRKLAPLNPRPCDEEHTLTATAVGDEWLVSFDHPMEKGHFIAGLLEVGYDRFALVRMYPEGGREMYLPRLSGGKIFMICARDGMFAHR